MVKHALSLLAGLVFGLMLGIILFKEASPPPGGLIDHDREMRQSNWFNKLNYLKETVGQLRRDEVPNEDDLVLKAAEEALIRHLDTKPE